MVHLPEGAIVRARLRELLDASSLSHAEIARRMGEAPSWISHRLTGYATLKVEEIRPLAEALGMDPCELACALLMGNGDAEAKRLSLLGRRGADDAYEDLREASVLAEQFRDKPEHELDQAIDLIRRYLERYHGERQGQQ